MRSLGKALMMWSALFASAILTVLAFGASPATAHTLVTHLTGGGLMIAGATVGANVVTLADWAKRMDPDGKVAKVVELLSQLNEIINHMAWVQGNLPTGHRTTVRTGLPAVYWRLLNKGVPKGKSTTAQVDEQAGMLEARSEVDVDLAALNDDVAGFRLSEATPFMEALTQEFVQTLFYGSSSAPEEFVGLATRYSSLSATNGQNIINGGGSGSDNASIYLIGWGDQTVHGLFPKGSKAGIVHEDLGIGDALDANNDRFRAYMDRWQIKGGVCVKDWRYVVRICNIDISNLVAESSNADLIKLMTKAWHRIPNHGAARFGWYMNRTCAEFLDVQRQDATKSGGGITKETIDGESRLSFRGIPIYITDQLLETEATVS